MPARRIELDNTEIKRRYENGEGSTAIAKALNVSSNTILNRLRELGITRRRSGPAPKYDDAEICRMYQAGASVADIKEKTGAKNSATFYAILRRNGVPVRLQRRRCECPDIQARIKELHAQGLAQAAIAEKVGINRNYIGKFLRQEIAVDRKVWQPPVRVTHRMSIQEMRDRDLTIDEIAEITGESRVTVFQELHNQSL